MKKVFLSGPMRGVPRQVGLAWRLSIQARLQDVFEVVHAYRGREERETFPDPKGAILRDKNDIAHSDVIIVNDTFREASMIGTSMEVLFAYERDIPIIIFGDAHAGDYWLDHHATMRLASWEDACDVCVKLFHD